MGDSLEKLGRGWIVVTEWGKGVEPNINTELTMLIYIQLSSLLKLARL